MAWYDRRNDTNNSLIDLFGAFAAIQTNGNVVFDPEFKITTTSFPPVFAGTFLQNTNIGFYDPVYPPGDRNLNWWYPEWPEFIVPGVPIISADVYKGHVGEYNGSWGNETSVYVSWTDYRLQSVGTLFPRNQSDVRSIRLNWPE